jgi:hypothetical protein
VPQLSDATSPLDDGAPLEDLGHDGTPEGTVGPEPTRVGPEPTEAPDATQGRLAEAEAASTKDRPAPKPPRPSIIERFAQSQGFRKDGEDRFFHADGSWIGKARRPISLGAADRERRPRLAFSRFESYQAASASL